MVTLGVLDAVFARRSLGRLVEPAPSEEELQRILEAAAAAPDHERLRPWRFIVLRGPAKDAFGEVLVDALLVRQPDASPTAVEKERTKLGRAPVVVVVAAVPQESAKVPWEEQFAAVAAATQNMLLAATELGFGSMWRTGDPAYDPRVKVALGLTPSDAIVGFVYLGTPSGGTEKSPNRPVLDGLVRTWSP